MCQDRIYLQKAPGLYKCGAHKSLMRRDTLGLNPMHDEKRPQTNLTKSATVMPELGFFGGVNAIRALTPSHDQ